MRFFQLKCLFRVGVDVSVFYFILYTARQETTVAHIELTTMDVFGVYCNLRTASQKALVAVAHADGRETGKWKLTA